MLAVLVGSGKKKKVGKGELESPSVPVQKKTTAKKQKTSHDKSSSSVTSSLPEISQQSPSSPGNWILSDCDWHYIYFGF